MTSLISYTDMLPVAEAQENNSAWDGQCGGCNTQLLEREQKMQILWVFFGTWVAWAVFAAFKNWSGTVVFGGGFLVSCIALIVAIQIQNRFEPDSPARNSEPQIKTVSIIREPSLGISTAQFKERFNKISEEIDAPFHINQVNVEQGNVNTFSVMLGKNNALSGTVTKDDQIEGLISISNGDGTIQSGMKMLQLSVIIVRTFSSELSKEDASKLVLEMMNKNSTLPNATAHSKAVGKVEYFTSLSTQLGYFFGVQIAK